MKKSNLWLGVLAITLIFAMTAVGCDNDPADCCAHAELAVLDQSL